MQTISQNLANIPWHKEFNGFGDAAATNTATKMKDIINLSAKNPYIRRWTEKILSTKDVKSYDWVGEVEAIHNWVRDNIRYTHDPAGIEYLQTPPTLLMLIEKGERPMGDCDDMSMLTLSMLKSIGYEVGLKVTSYKSDGAYQHVYGIVRVPVSKPSPEGYSVQNIWLATDTIKPEKHLGWEAPNPTRTFTMKI